MTGFGAIRRGLWSDQPLRSDPQARSDASQARETAQDLERRLEKLLLLTRAMWTLVQERTGITEEQLLRRATEIDLLDGRADGKVSVRASMCTQCNRTVAPRHPRCIYCGEERLTDTVFETV